MLKKNILFIGSFGGKLSVINGGQTFACKQIIDNEYMKNNFHFILIDNLSLKKTSDFRFFDKFKNVLLRFLLLNYYTLTRKFDIVIIYTSESYAFYEKGFYVLFLNLFNKKIIFSPRSGLMIQWLNSTKANRFANLVFQKCNIILCQGDFWKNFYLKQFKLNNEKVKVLRNFINTKSTLFINKSDLNTTINVIYLGWIHEKKGILKLLEFIEFSKNRLNIKLNICGEGDLEKECRSFCNLNNLNNIVKFHGWVTGNEKEKLLRESHFIFLLSDVEGLPNSILEGMNFGNIPIVTNVGSLNELVTLDSGLIMDIIDFDLILNFINSLKSNTNQFLRMSESNISFINKYYSNSAFELNIKNILESI